MRSAGGATRAGLSMSALRVPTTHVALKYSIMLPDEKRTDLLKRTPRRRGVLWNSRPRLCSAEGGSLRLTLDWVIITVGMKGVRTPRSFEQWLLTWPALLVTTLIGIVTITFGIEIHLFGH